MTVTADVALDRLGPDAVLSHESAARRLGIDLVHAGGDHLTVPRDRSRRRVEGWRVHRRDCAPHEIRVVDGLSQTAPVRTVHDLARTLPLGEALAAAESAVRAKQVTADDLTAALEASTGAWAERPRTVAALLAPADSVLESLAAALFHEAGLTPRRQFDISDPHGQPVATVDFCWPEARLVVEVDGFAFHSDREAYRRDRKRLNALAQRGWRVLRLTWEDVVGHPAVAVALVVSTLRYEAA